jgi:hypothetical protein
MVFYITRDAITNMIICDCCGIKYEKSYQGRYAISYPLNKVEDNWQYRSLDTCPECSQKISKFFSDWVIEKETQLDVNEK